MVVTKCIFKEDTHQYFLVDVETGDVVKELISVTTLLSKHGLSANYDGVPTETLKAKAEYGTLVHKEIEKYINDGEIGFTSELNEFIDYLVECNIKPLKSEFIVCNDIVAGTVDLLAQGDGVELDDYKTTATLHKDAVRWQLSLYNYLLGQKADKLKALHFNNPLKVVTFEPVPTEEIEKLLDCERNGEIYQGRQLAVADELLQKVAECENQIEYYKLLTSEIEAQATEFRNQLTTAMREQGIDLFETDYIRVKYTAPTTQERIDSARLKKELPDVAKQYTKTSNVKDRVTITLKKGEKK